MIAAEQAVEARRTLRDGIPRIASFASAGTTLVPDVLRAFHAEHPGVRISLEELEEPGAVVDGVLARRLEVGIVFTVPDHFVRPVAGLAVKRLFADSFVLALPKGHPRAGREAIGLHELAAERWITACAASDPCAVVLDRACRAAGFEPDIAFRIDDYAMVGSCVAAGLGVGLVPELAIPRLPEGVALVQLAGEPLAREVYAVLLGDGSSLPAGAFVAALQREAPSSHR